MLSPHRLSSEIPRLGHATPILDAALQHVPHQGLEDAPDVYAEVLEESSVFGRQRGLEALSRDPM